MTVVADTRPLRHWLRSADGPHLVIGCAEHPDPRPWSRTVVCAGSRHAVVQLGTCIAKVPPAVLLELVAGGARGITAALDGCANASDAEAVVARAGSFLSALGRPETIDGAFAVPRDRKHGAAWPILGDGGVPVSRRVLLGRRDGLVLAAPSEHPAERLVAVLRELVGGDGSGTELDGIPTGVPRLTASRCAGSGVCARSCPVGALKLTRTVLAEASPEQDQQAMTQFQLTFDPARCTDCQQCVGVCPESALEVSKAQGEIAWSGLLGLVGGEQVTLRVGLIRPCARCGASNGRFGDLCAVCAFRAANPFGSSMPPGWSKVATDPELLGQLPAR